MGGKTVTVPETTGTLYYSKTFYDKNAQSVTVDAEGKAQITFPSDGTWYLWADGSYGKSAGNEESIVSAPAYAKVIVTNKDKDAAQAVADSSMPCRPLQTLRWQIRTPSQRPGKPFRP